MRTDNDMTKSLLNALLPEMVLSDDQAREQMPRYFFNRSERVARKASWLDNEPWFRSAMSNCPCCFSVLVACRD